MSQLNHSKIPQHIAIIMDGNGRWAKSRGLSRSMGHQEGAEVVRQITEAASNLGLRYLTLYTFSTENWNRPETEVAALMSLIIESLEEELFMKNNVRLRIVGDFARLPDFVQSSLQGCMDRTAANTGMTMVLALSYSSRDELTRAFARLAAERAAQGISPTAPVSEADIARHLDTAFMPEPELLIRTGGELRLSNYLLWQCAYSELYFTDCYWPDFSPAQLEAAILSYQQRERRFGKTSEQLAPPSAED